MAAVADPVREKALQDYRKKLLEHKEVESRLKESELLKLRSSCFHQNDFAIFFSSRGTQRAHKAV
jgi:hypothetical protein